MAHEHITGRVVLVTGGTGFLGSYLIPLAILARGDADEGQGCAVTLTLGSVCDARAVIEACEGVHSMFHLAGLVVHSRTVGVQQMQNTNVEGTLNVVRAAARCKVNRVVYASTSGVVGCSDSSQAYANDQSEYCTEKVARWPYYASKIEAEQKGRALAKELGVEFISMRPSMMLGPGDERYRSTHSILSYLRRSLPILPSGGVSLVDVRDVAEMFVRAMNHGEPDGTYLLTAINCSIKDMFLQLQSISGVAPPFWSKLPWPIIIAGAHVLNTLNTQLVGEWKSGVDPVKAEMTASFWNVSPERAILELGFRPRPVRDTLRETVLWIQEHRSTRLKASL